VVILEPEAFMDASGTGPPTQILSVSGYLLGKDESAQLHHEWADILQPIIGEMPETKRYFHMTDFMNRRHPYDRLNEAERAYLNRRLVDSINTHVAFGVSASVKRDEFNDANLPDKTAVLGSAYTMCGLWCMDALAEHAVKSDPDCRIAYFFESGDKDEFQLKSFLDKMVANDEMAERLRYAGHASIPKHEHHALGAADMLAWEFRNGIENYLLRGNPEPRVFWELMMNKPILAEHFHPQKISIAFMVEKFRQVRLLIDPTGQDPD